MTSPDRRETPAAPVQHKLPDTYVPQVEEALRSHLDEKLRKQVTIGTDPDADDATAEDPIIPAARAMLGKEIIIIPGIVLVHIHTCTGETGGVIRRILAGATIAFNADVLYYDHGQPEHHTVHGTSVVMSLGTAKLLWAIDGEVVNEGNPDAHTLAQKIQKHGFKAHDAHHGNDVIDTNLSQLGYVTWMDLVETTGALYALLEGEEEFRV